MAESKTINHTEEGKGVQFSYIDSVRCVACALLSDWDSDGTIRAGREYNTSLAHKGRQDDYFSTMA